MVVMLTPTEAEGVTASARSPLLTTREADSQPHSTCTAMNAVMIDGVRLETEETGVRVHVGLPKLVARLTVDAGRMVDPPGGGPVVGFIQVIRHHETCAGYPSGAFTVTRTRHFKAGAQRRDINKSSSGLHASTSWAWPFVLGNRPRRVGETLHPRRHLSVARIEAADSGKQYTLHFRDTASGFAPWVEPGAGEDAGWISQIRLAEVGVIYLAEINVDGEVLLLHGQTYSAEVTVDLGAGASWTVADCSVRTSALSSSSVRQHRVNRSVLDKPGMCLSTCLGTVRIRPGSLYESLAVLSMPPYELQQAASRQEEEEAARQKFAAPFESYLFAPGTPARDGRDRSTTVEASMLDDPSAV